MTKKLLCLALCLMLLFSAAPALAAKPSYDSTQDFIAVLEDEDLYYEYSGRTKSDMEVVVLNYTLGDPYGDVDVECYFPENQSLAYIRVHDVIAASDADAGLRAVNELNIAFNFTRFVYDESDGGVSVYADVVATSKTCGEITYNYMDRLLAILTREETIGALSALVPSKGSASNAKASFFSGSGSTSTKASSGYLSYHNGEFVFGGADWDMDIEDAVDKIAKATGRTFEDNGGAYMGYEYATPFKGLGDGCYSPLIAIVPEGDGWWMECQLTREDITLGTTKEARAFAMDVWAQLEAMGAEAEYIVLERDGKNSEYRSVKAVTEAWLDAADAGEVGVFAYVYAGNMLFSLERTQYGDQAHSSCWIILNR